MSLLRANSPSPLVPKSGAGRASERGSAYLAVLMLLVVLTILGLSLSVVTQTEVIIGGSEKQTVRQLYEAESAIHIAYAAKMVGRDTKAKLLVMQRPDQSAFATAAGIGDLVCVTMVHASQESFSNLGMVNEGKDDYRAAQFGVTATALRHGESDLGAKREVGALLGLDPTTVTSEELSYTPPDWTSVSRGSLVSTTPSDELNPCFRLYLRF